MATAPIIPAQLAFIKVVVVKKLIGLLYKRPFTHKGNCIVDICDTTGLKMPADLLWLFI